MDLSTTIGMVTAFGLIVLGILLGSPLSTFFDLVSVVIVIGGTIASIFIAVPVPGVINAGKSLKTAFMPPKYDTTAMISQLSELSNRARREGLLSLEDAANQTDDDFLKRGLLMMADGHEAAVIESVLFDEIGKMEERHKSSIGVFDAMGAYGPAFGMIGTLIGLVQMLQQMDDPNAIGPAMAVALLTTFYGSVLANVIGIPIANKLKVRSGQEIAFKELIAAGLLSILAGENPRFMIERLNATLPPSDRYEEAA